MASNSSESYDDVFNGGKRVEGEDTSTFVFA